jgi:hypothetical protein
MKLINPERNFLVEEKLQRIELDFEIIKWSSAASEDDSYENTRTLVGMYKKRLDGGSYGPVATDTKSNIRSLANKLPTISNFPSNVHYLYFGAYGNFRAGMEDRGLACFKLLYSMEPYAKHFHEPFNKMILEGAAFYKSRIDEEGAEFLNSLNVQEELLKGGGGCFIATAVYGSEVAPEVIVLRRFRDEALLPTLSGRIFIKIYYAISPSIACMLKHLAPVRQCLRLGVLNPIVRRIQSHKNH